MRPRLGLRTWVSDWALTVSTVLDLRRTRMIRMGAWTVGEEARRWVATRSDNTFLVAAFSRSGREWSVPQTGHQRDSRRRIHTPIPILKRRKRMFHSTIHPPVQQNVKDHPATDIVTTSRLQLLLPSQCIDSTAILPHPVFYSPSCESFGHTVGWEQADSGSRLNLPPRYFPNSSDKKI